MWFIVSLIYMNVSTAAPEILVYKETYSSLDSCHTVSQAYPSPLIDHLQRLKPQANRISIRCVTLEQLLFLKNNNRMLVL